MLNGLYQFPEGQIIAFALVFLRLIAFVIAWPVFGAAVVPVPLKVLLGLVFSMIVFPTISFQNVDMIAITDQIIFMAIRELLIGLFLGFLMRMFFFAVSVAGEIISVTMGLASAQLFNPAMGTSSNVVEQFQVLLATLFFLAMNGHHLFIAGIAQSFELVPIAVVGIKTAGFMEIAEMGQQILLLGLKMSAPILVSIFIVNVAMGILGKAVPQINVLVTSMPVTIMLGFGVLMITTPLFINEMSGLVDIMATNFIKAMKVM